MVMRKAGHDECLVTKSGKHIGKCVVCKKRRVICCNQVWKRTSKRWIGIGNKCQKCCDHSYRG